MKIKIDESILTNVVCRQGWMLLWKNGNEGVNEFILQENTPSIL